MSGYYTLASTSALAYCDATLGADYYQCEDCASFSRVTDEDGCPEGMSPVIPRSREHWLSMVGWLMDVEGLEWHEVAEYFQIFPGVTSPANEDDMHSASRVCDEGMSSDTCDDLAASDGGTWWIRDTEYRNDCYLPAGCHVRRGGDWGYDTWNPRFVYQDLATPGGVEMPYECHHDCPDSGDKYVCSSNKARRPRNLSRLCRSI